MCHVCESHRHHLDCGLHLRVHCYNQLDCVLTHQFPLEMTEGLGASMETIGSKRERKKLFVRALWTLCATRETVPRTREELVYQ